ncbi:hypothetical protein [Dysosmobacter sp. Phy]
MWVDVAYDLLLFCQGLRDQSIRFYVRLLTRSASPLGGVSGSTFTYNEKRDFYTYPGVLCGQERLRSLSLESEARGKGVAECLERDYF